MADTKDIKQEANNNQADSNQASAINAPKATQKRGGSDNRGRGGKRQGGGNRREERTDSEYEQQILDLARVTRVMAGGKRMRFRACVALGNRRGKVGIGLAKGADVTLAVTKAVNQAKKKMIDVPLAAGETIPHRIKTKFGAGSILLLPARQGRGVICGGVVRMIAELAGIKNVTGKILGTNNNVTNAKCMIKALSSLKPLKTKKKNVTVETKAEEQSAEAKK